MSNTKTFQWTDEEVIEIIKDLQKGLTAGIKDYDRYLSCFRKPKQEGNFHLNDEAGKWATPKPPLGVMPEFIHKEQRLDDIIQAMNRFNNYHNHKKLCPQEWLDEKHALEKWLNDFNNKLKEEEVPKRIEVTKFQPHGNFRISQYEFEISNGEIPREKYEAVKKAISDVLNNEGSKVVCRIQVGMEIEYTTNDNWDRKGHKATVRAFGFPEDKVWLSDGQRISIEGFLDNIDSGRYKVTHYPIPLPETQTTKASPSNSFTNTQDWEIKMWRDYHTVHNDRERGGSIFSVFRKSDGVVFSCGDRCIYKGIHYIIKEFRLSNDGTVMWVFFSDDGDKCIALLNDIKSETKDNTTPEKKKYYPEDVMGCFFAMARVDEKTIEDYLENVKK